MSTPVEKITSSSRVPSFNTCIGAAVFGIGLMCLASAVRHINLNYHAIVHWMGTPAGMGTCAAAVAAVAGACYFQASLGLCNGLGTLAGDMKKHPFIYGGLGSAGAGTSIMYCC